MSSGLVKLLGELKDKSAPQKIDKHNEVFMRLKKKFSILLPPLKTDVRII